MAPAGYQGIGLYTKRNQTAFFSLTMNQSCHSLSTATRATVVSILRPSHFTIEKYKEGRFDIRHVRSAENLADICTKALPRPTLEKQCPTWKNTATSRDCI